MTREKALQILGLQDPVHGTEIKKKYRALMLMTHPDMAENIPYPYEASEINVAYDYLLANLGKPWEHSNKKQKETKLRWNAPVNPNAYAEREIYHSVESSDGEVIGVASIDFGRYLWIEDEDFSLFLKSLYECSKRIIHKSDEKMNRDREENIKLLSEITYLLAQQYVDSDMILSFLAGEDIDSEVSSDHIYHVDAMVELNTSSLKKQLHAGQLLYPEKISSHRLYVSDGQKEIGYVSFKDDRLYYGIIPLLERRAALIKMVITDVDLKRINRKSYVEMDLALKMKKEDKMQMAESISWKIERLLEKVI